MMKRELGRLEDTFYIPGSNPKPTFFAQAECNALLHIEQSTISPKGWSLHIWHFSSSSSRSFTVGVLSPTRTRVMGKATK